MPEQTKRYIPPPSSERVYHLLLFGDLSMAGMIHPMVVSKKDTYEFYFKPSPAMVFKYQIQDYEVNSARGCIIKEYPKELCISVSDYPTTWIVLCDYHGQSLENNFISRINSTALNINKMLSKELMAERVMRAQLSYEIMEIIKHPNELDARLIERFQKYKEIVGITQVQMNSGEEQAPYEQR